MNSASQIDDTNNDDTNNNDANKDHNDNANNNANDNVGNINNSEDIKNKKVKEIKTRLLACLPCDKFNSIMKLLNEKEEEKIIATQLVKGLTSTHQNRSGILGNNPKHNPDTPHGQVEPKNQRN